jgi:methyl-accepting chemotaxis protein
MNTTTLSAPEPHGSTVPWSNPEALRTHGIMGPGIRMFRRISFAAKAAWVSAAFLVPLCYVQWTLVDTKLSGIAFSEKERVGVAVSQPLFPLLDASQNWRRAATANSADLDAAGQRVQEALNKLVQTDPKLVGELDLEDNIAQLKAKQQSLANAPRLSDSASTFAAHTELVSAVLELVEAAADNSNLTLDPDLDTFYLMNIAYFVQAPLLEALGQLRGSGNAALREGQLSAERRDLVARNLGVVDVNLGNLVAAVGKATKADPSLKGELGVERLIADTRAFANLVRSSFLGAQVQGQADAYLAAANGLMKGHFEVTSRVKAALDARLEERIAREWRSLWTSLVISVIALAAAVYLLVAFYKVTEGGIREVARQLDRLACGDLTTLPKPWGRDEVAGLMNTLAKTILSLRGVVGGVLQSAQAIELASSEVASASLDLSNRTETSAANLQRTSAAMVQIEGTVSQTASTADGAATIVVRNADVASEGGRIVGEVVNTMAQIQDSSKRIADIIGVIDSIAFQTNILALNAAVEAARAGESGRGFAVVAGEVRALAQRTAKAAQEVKTLIESSVAQVESGGAVVARAGGTMREIVGNADRIRGLIAEISTAAQEQRVGLSDVGQSVQQLDNATQQNAALVEQTAAAAASLKDGAQRLKREVQFFQLPG